MTMIPDLNLTQPVWFLHHWFSFEMIYHHTWCYLDRVLRELQILGSPGSSRSHLVLRLKPLWLGMLQLVRTYMFTMCRCLCFWLLLRPDSCPLFLGSWYQDRVSMLGWGRSRVLWMVVRLKFHACFRWSGEEIGDALVLYISKRRPCSVNHAWRAS